MRPLPERQSKHQAVGHSESGGKNLGVRPMEMLLMGLGGGSAFDVVLILRKGRQQVTDLSATRADSEPKCSPRSTRLASVLTDIPHGVFRSAALKQQCDDPGCRR